jgi:hypothetical protein
MKTDVRSCREHAIRDVPLVQCLMFIQSSFYPCASAGRTSPASRVATAVTRRSTVFAVGISVKRGVASHITLTVL